jgi:hypothetical protein
MWTVCWTPLFELHFSRRSEYIRIAQEYRSRYDSLNEDRAEFYHYYLDKGFDLKKLKKEHPDDYEKIILWEVRFFWFCFDEWLKGNVRRSVPRYLKRDWEYAIKVAMRISVHRQAWQEKGREMDFWGYKEVQPVYRGMREDE